MTTFANPIKDQTGAPRVRKNIRSLTDEELNNLRNAYEGLYKVSEDGSNNDERGYQWIAGVHGFPVPVYCQHGNINFPTWHRAYIYEFELRLQEQVESVMLPYWDWTSEETANVGMPKAVIDPTYLDLNTGETKPNPLFSAFSQVTNSNTARRPGPLSEFQILQSQVNFAQQRDTYSSYSSALEQPHGGLHVWVGGDMGSVPIAAYDPIFWLHHCNVDRYWYEWQQVHGNASVPQTQLDFICAPFSYTGEDTLDTGVFGYTYADSENFVSADEVLPAPQDLLAPTMVFDLGKIDKGVESAELAFYGLKHTKDSYKIRVYCAADGYDDKTKWHNEDAYANTIYLFGHGECGGGAEHCTPKPRKRFDLRPEHHLTPYNLTIDVSKGVKNAVESGQNSVQLSFVVLNNEDKQVDSSVIEFEALSIIANR